MPSFFDRFRRRRKAPPEPEGLYSPPERGAEDPEPAQFNVGDSVKAAGRDQAGAAAHADGVRRPLPGPFVVPDGTVGVVRGVDLDLIFVAFPVQVPVDGWRGGRQGTRLISEEPIETAWGVIPKGHVVQHPRDASAGALEVTLMLQFPKNDWWNQTTPEARHWGKHATFYTRRAREEGDDPARGSVVWQGLPISIELFAGDSRPPFGRLAACPYGYFDDVIAVDGDSLDVMLGAEWQDLEVPVWILEQLAADGSGETFQFKTMLGFPSREAAEGAFLALWPPHMLGDAETCTPAAFVAEWLPKLDEGSAE